MQQQRELPVLRVVDGDSLRRRLERREVHEISHLAGDLFPGCRVTVSETAWHAGVRLGGAARQLGMTEDGRARALAYLANCAIARGDSSFTAELITDYAWTEPRTFTVRREGKELEIQLQDG